jgi:hypothetical protein
MTAAQHSTTSQAAGSSRSDSATVSEQTSTEILNYVLQRAAFAHHFHELELGGPHADWAPWYAAHMAETLSDHGYRILLAPTRGGLDTTADPKEGVAEEAEARKGTNAGH